ncbi:MAG: phytoene/squalene synthase family protein [Clostridiales bacterium]
MKELYDRISYKASRIITRAYSTSFSLGILFIKKSIRKDIYAIYGFVRLADEIVDTFHDYNKELLLERFKKDVYRSIEEGISLNPVLNSFQLTVNKYKISVELIDQFLHSMEMDLKKQTYNPETYKEYILGSAEVVGLMCLKVFSLGNDEQYQRLKPHAMSLGSAYQKINFLRDLKDDYQNLGRTYFPGIKLENFNEDAKYELMRDIQKDFSHGYQGIKKLPKTARFGVYLSFKYYYGLFKKIKRVKPQEMLIKRVRISDERKIYMLFRSAVIYKLNLF